MDTNDFFSHVESFCSDIFVYAWRSFPLDTDVHTFVLQKHLEMVQAIACHSQHTIAHCLRLDAFYNVCRLHS